MSKKTDDRKNIVVVGGGGGGARTAHLLSKSLDASKYNLTLIDSRPYFILLPSVARLVVSDIDNLDKNSFVPLDKIFHNNNGTFVQGKVTAIEKQPDSKGGHVILDNGERVVFDALILSPGSIWGGPLALPGTDDKLRVFIANTRAAFKAANDIVLAGGGAVGVELAGEIKDRWPEKSVTIVQGDKALLNGTYPNKYRRRLEQSVRAKKINIVFDDYVDEIPEGSITEVKTRGGKTLKANLVLSTRGPQPNTTFIASSLGADTITERGFVKVKSTLQLPAHPEIFAVGDILDIQEQKQLAKAQNHALIVSTNILAYFEGKPLKEYKGSTEMIAVTVGKTGGVGYVDILWGIVLGDWFMRLVKSKTLLVDKMWGIVGLKLE